jgi:hypothetical protein
MVLALRPCRRLQLAPLCCFFSSPSFSGAGEGDPLVDAAAATAVRPRTETVSRTEAYRQVQNFDWSNITDWKTATNIIFTVPPKRKLFGLASNRTHPYLVGCRQILDVFVLKYWYITYRSASAQS